MEPLTNSPSNPPPPPEKPAPAHEAGQTIGPDPSSRPVQPTAAAPTDPIAPITDDRPVGVIYSNQTPNIINGKIITPDSNIPSGKSGRRFHLSRKLVIPLAALVVLLGGSAAAYYGYYIPNKPQNILVKALENSLTQPAITSSGTLNLTSSGVSSVTDYTVKADNNGHLLDLNLTTTVSGVKVPLEIMSAKGNLYFKFGDLSTVTGLLSQFAGAFDPSFQQLGDKINKAVSNQWIEVDSTLVKEAKLDCLANYPAALTPADVQSLENSYTKSPFATIVSHTTESVNGTAANKYVLQIDDNKLAGFGLSGASYFKNLNSCLKSSNASAVDLSQLKDNDKTPLTLWVDKTTKQIVKYASQTTAQDKTKKLTGNLSGTLSYGSVSITAPANAKPILNLVNDLGLGDLVNGFISGSSSSSTAAKDTERKTDISALQGQIEAYWAEKGYYPTLAELNNSSWRTTNLSGLDSAALQDPAGSTQTLSASPAAHVYAYQVTPVGCDNLKTQCANYILTATLENGTTYVKQSTN